MVKHTRKIKNKRNGGSYRTPMNPITDFHLRILTAHGTISPEYYYIVPDNVYLLLPNECGVRTTTAEVVSQSLFQPAEEGVRTFFDRFVKGGSKTAEGAPFTVYEPGDILPMHVFTFDSRLRGVHSFVRKATSDFTFGFVGAFQPGSLEKLPFVDHAVVDGDGIKNNHFLLVWKDMERGYDFDTRTYNFYPKFHWVLQNYCMEVLNYLRTKGETYLEILKPYIGATSGSLTREQCADIFRYIIPVIPENTMASKILATGEYRYSMHDVIAHFSSQIVHSKPLIILMNTCRSLQETETLEVDWNDNVVKKGKPSLALVRTVSNYGHTNDSDVAVNMKAINAFRATKGLSSVNDTVLKYDQMLAILAETYASYNSATDSVSGPLMKKMEPLLDVLGSYAPRPVDAVVATKYMDEHVGRIKANAEARAIAATAASAAAAAAEGAAQKARDLAALKRRRDKLKEDIAFLKRGKKNTGELKAELSAVLEGIRSLE